MMPPPEPCAIPAPAPCPPPICGAPPPPSAAPPPPNGLLLACGGAWKGLPSLGLPPGPPPGGPNAAGEPNGSATADDGVGAPPAWGPPEAPPAGPPVAAAASCGAPGAAAPGAAGSGFAGAGASYRPSRSGSACGCGGGGCCAAVPLRAICQSTQRPPESFRKGTRGRIRTGCRQRRFSDASAVEHCTCMRGTTHTNAGSSDDSSWPNARLQLVANPVHESQVQQRRRLGGRAA